MPLGSARALLLSMTKVYNYNSRFRPTREMYGSKDPSDVWPVSGCPCQNNIFKTIFQARHNQSNTTAKVVFSH